MKIPFVHFLPSAIAGLGLAAVIYAFVSESRMFRAAVVEWASRDLAARTELAAQALEEPLAVGDFRRLRLFGDECRNAGVRLTVLSAPGGMIYDTLSAAHGHHAACPEVVEAREKGVGHAFRRSATADEQFLYCARKIDGGFVRLAVPQSRVFALVDRSRTPTLLAGLAGVCAFLFISLFTGRLRARYRALAQERDEQERRLAELRRAEDFRRSFVSDVTHEIKTPLTGILAAVDLLQEEGEASDAAERQTLLALLRKESTRLNDLVKDVLSLARLEQGPDEFPHAFGNADLAVVMGEVVDRMRPKAGKVNLAVQEGSLDSLPCVCDAKLVGQALDNLVENALRYSGSKDVVLGLAREGDMAVLAVEDHGVGIPPAHRARVFERFYRVDKARSREMGGTGLGLAIVKHIARLHGGEAALAEAPGGGCRFTISLSLHKQDNNGKEKNT